MEVATPCNFHATANPLTSSIYNHDNIRSALRSPRPPLPIPDGPRQQRKGGVEERDTDDGNGPDWAVAGASLSGWRVEN